LVFALGAALLKTIIYESYVLLNVVSRSTVAELEAVTVDNKVKAPELGVAKLNTPDPLV
jgi:hypothetical protein